MQLNAIGAKWEHCDNNGFARIALIKWELDNSSHTPYIDNMFIWDQGCLNI